LTTDLHLQVIADLARGADRRRIVRDADTVLRTAEVDSVRVEALLAKAMCHMMFDSGLAEALHHARHAVSLGPGVDTLHQAWASCLLADLISRDNDLDGADNLLEYIRRVIAPGNLVCFGLASLVDGRNRIRRGRFDGEARQQLKFAAEDLTEAGAHPAVQTIAWCHHVFAYYSADEFTRAGMALTRLQTVAQNVRHERILNVVKLLTHMVLEHPGLPEAPSCAVEDTIKFFRAVRI
jgi:hypothetical protein